jgi:hypothetical protein
MCGKEMNFNKFGIHASCARKAGAYPKLGVQKQHDVTTEKIRTWMPKEKAK